MSAYIVSNETIDCLVRAAVTLGGQEGFRWSDRGRDGLAESTRVCVVAPSWSPQRCEAWGGVVHSEAEFGQLLVDWNRRSVRCRYPDSPDMWGGEEPARYPGPRPDGRFDSHDEPPLENVLGCLRCLEYQSCEHPTYSLEPGAYICDALARLVLLRLADLHLGEQPWGLEAAAPRGTRADQLLSERDAIRGPDRARRSGDSAETEGR